MVEGLEPLLVDPRIIGGVETVEELVTRHVSHTSSPK
jgi:hypothetical protein